MGRELANGSHSSSRRVRLCTLVLLGGHSLLIKKFVNFVLIVINVKCLRIKAFTVQYILQEKYDE